MTKKFLPLIVLLLFCGCTGDTEKVNTAKKVIQLQKLAAISKSDSTYIYLKQSEKLLLTNASREKDSLLTENYFALGEYFASQKENDSTVYYKFKGIRSIDSISNNREMILFYNTYYQLSSLSKYGDCITLVDEFEKRISPDDYASVSVLYFFREDIAKSERKVSLALSYNIKRNEALKYLKDMNMLAPGLISRAGYYYSLKDKKKAFEVLDTLVTNESKLNYNSKRQLYGKYATYTFYEQQFVKSLSYNFKVLENIRADNSPKLEKINSLAVAFSNISEVYIELRQYDKAEKYIDSVKNYLGFQNISKRNQREILKYQLRLQSLNNSDNKQVTQLLDSIFDYQDKSYEDKYNKELVALKLETQEKEKIRGQQQTSEIRSLKLETRLIVVVVSSVLIFLVGVLYFILRKIRQEKKALYLQQRLLRTQMSPHFIFNTLSSIHNLMSTNTEKASTYLIKFSRLLRLVLENSLENYVILEDEIESIEKFLELQLLRFPDKFEYNISLEGLHPEISYHIPPMLLQPFIENSILHGFNGINYLGAINITISEKSKYLQCVIKDNGLGIQNLESSIKKSVSVGLISDFLQKATRSKVSIVSKESTHIEKGGVTVSFLIPYTTND